MTLEPTQKNLSIHILLLYSIWAIISFIPSVSSAQSWYIRPSAEIPLRSGKGQEYRIIAILQDGSQVKLLQEDGTWAKVRTASGKEGWMVERYLSTSPPLEDVVVRLKASKAKAESQLADINKKLDEVSSASKKCRHDLDACILERDRIKKTYEALKLDASSTIKFKQSLSKTTKQLLEARQRLLATEEENRHLKNMDRIKWFLAGGGVLIFGWIVGLITGRGRKRNSLIL
ncbi:MAG: TIGR04211 family SH3 domain-containing protein [Nitrospiraceae bacterium]|nr:TIGR04211 family SH3 domain-containing protein [Nitrospiraceae bacterium]